MGLWQKIKYRRSLVYWITTSLLYIGLFVLVYTLGRIYIPWLAGEILPRIPKFNDNMDIRLQVSNPNNLPVQVQLKNFCVGTSVYRFQPKLEVLGFIKEIEVKSEKVTLLLSIASQYRESILFDGTQFELLHGSPSMVMILQRFFEGANAKQFKDELMKLAGNNQTKLNAIFFRLTEILGTKLNNAKQANAILEDSILKCELLAISAKHISMKGL